MTDTTTPGDAPRRIGPERIIIGVLVVLVIGAMVYMSSQRQQALRSSPAGLDGLRTWLVTEGLSAQNFTGGWPLDEDEIGLNILPLYDTQLNNPRTAPTTQKELILQQDEYDLSSAQIVTKARRVKTLLVLPKWRSGMRLTGLAHPFLLVDQARVKTGLGMFLEDGPVQLIYARQPFTEFAYGDDLNAVVYASQMFSAPGCTPILGHTDAMILGECKLVGSDGEQTILILSDPDLINNHGLRLGDNAFIVRDFVRDIADDQQVIIDYSRRSWLTSGREREQRDRTWSDLARFFSPPFTLMWVGLALALLATLWRSAARFGPVAGSKTGLSASKMMAVGARAQLMRLTNQDGALVDEYAKARLATTANTLFGPAHGRRFASAEAFLGYTKRRHPNRAPRLTQVLNNIAAMPPGAPTAQAMAAVTDLEDILEQITDDTRGIKRPR
ncbi:MAG: hypothetical protein AAF393_04680 [Pseudomonadota bacterium]